MPKVSAAQLGRRSDSAGAGGNSLSADATPTGGGNNGSGRDAIHIAGQSDDRD